MQTGCGQVRNIRKHRPSGSVRSPAMDGGVTFVVSEYLYLAEKAAHLFACLRSVWSRLLPTPACAQLDSTRARRPTFGSRCACRDLPPYGARRHWQPLFQRTFEVYAKVRVVPDRNPPPNPVCVLTARVAWGPGRSYGSTSRRIGAFGIVPGRWAACGSELVRMCCVVSHRPTLRDALRLQRHEVGEVASRISQLYYHY